MNLKSYSLSKDQCFFWMFLAEQTSRVSLYSLVVQFSQLVVGAGPEI